MSPSRTLRLTAIALVAFTGLGCALKSDRQSVSDLYEASLRAYANGDFQVAATGLAEVVERVPSDQESWFRLGNAYSRTNRPIDAARSYEQAVLKDPRHARAWYNLGITRTRIAANSFLQMSRNLDSADPLRTIALEMGEALLDILDKPAATKGGSDSSTTQGLSQ